MIAVSVICFSVDAQHISNATEYLNVKEIKNFDGNIYYLSWSSHPTGNYYKQEYLRKGQSSDRYDNMMIIDLFLTSSSIKEIVGQQIALLKSRKNIDSYCNYQVRRNSITGNYILDFILSETKAGKTSTVEWNVYHYKFYTDNAGNKGVLLLGFSNRAYDKKTNDFLMNLKQTRLGMLKKMINLRIPDIQIQ